MKLDPPTKVSKDTMEIEVSELEPILQGYPMDLPKFPEAYITLKDGQKLYVREATEADVPLMLEYMEKIMKVDHDFYDIVGVRVYGEILGWYRKRLKDPFQLIGLIDGVWAGFANGRFMSQDIGISLHTLTFIRGARLGWAMYYVKTYYAMEMVKAGEWWTTFESYNGWRMGGLQLAQPSYPWPKVQHELGGARVYYVDQEYWNLAVKKYAAYMVGGELNFNVPDEIKKANEVFKIPDKVSV